MVLIDVDAYDKVLADAMNDGRTLYSAAYVMPSPSAFGATRKHTNHLRLLAFMLEGGLADNVTQAPSLRALYETLLANPSLGPFLAFQYAIDINYSTLTGFDEMDHVVAGPGAKDGLRKCFGDASVGIESDLIRWVAETQNEHLERLGLEFDGLWGRPLQLIDCQNLFCEVDKYARSRTPGGRGPLGPDTHQAKVRAGRPHLDSMVPTEVGYQRCRRRPQNLQGWKHVSASLRSERSQTIGSTGRLRGFRRRYLGLVRWVGRSSLGGQVWQQFRQLGVQCLYCTR